MRVFLILLLSTVLTGCTHTQSTLQEVTTKYNTPDKIAFWGGRNIWYKKDRVNNWQSPQETLQLKTGDCEDMAAFIYYVLSKNGYKCKLIKYKKRQKGHVICAIKSKKDDRWDYISNFHVKRVGGRGIIGMIDKIDSDWKSFSEIDYRDKIRTRCHRG